MDSRRHPRASSLLGSRKPCGLLSRPSKGAVVICSGRFLMNRYKDVVAHCEYYADRRFNIYTGSQPTEDEPQIKGRVSDPLHSPVYDLLGKRIAVLILDESHYAKSPAAKVYKSIHPLRYHRALLLTATPMFNNWRDMHIRRSRWACSLVVVHLLMSNISQLFLEFIMDVEGSEEPQSLPLWHGTSFTGGEEVKDDPDGSIPVTLPSAEKLAKSQYWKSKLSSTEVEDIISPRVHAVLDCVRKDYDSFPGQMTMVVSASLRFLQLIAEAIKRELHHLEVVEYNGEVPPKERARRLEKINTQGGSSILLLTAGADGTGLNVTGVSHVLPTGPQWNLGLEVQIFGRSYRLGQKHQVRVSKLFCEKSLVEQIKKKKEAVTKPMYDFLIREDQEPFSPTPLPFDE